MSEEKTLKVKASDESLEEVNAFIHSLCDKQQIYQYSLQLIQNNKRSML